MFENWRVRSIESNSGHSIIDSLELILNFDQF